ncbi:hypothetical protein E3T24_00190 [Cryobacterium sp. TmT2-59]|nr:hypothetical protein E3T24_00190 [Cryobacterium sp. TmT2-59]
MNVVDNPWAINAVCALLVTIHAVTTGLGKVPNVWKDFLDADRGLQASIYLGLLGGAAIVAGFAGVVVVFGLSATSIRFRQLRISGGKSLAANWASTSSSGLSATGLSLLASILVPTALLFIAPWLFELAILFIVHSSVRLIWLLRSIIEVVRIDDIAIMREFNKKSLAELPWHE